MSLDSIQFRSATVTDLPQIAEIENKVHISPWSSQQLRQSIETSDVFWVALEQRSIIAYCVLMPVAGQCELLNLAVHSKWQGKGVGRICLSHVFQQAQLQSIEEIFLEVRETNQAAIKLYLNSGFRSVGCRKNYYQVEGHGEDALIMQRVLSKDASCSQ